MNYQHKLLRNLNWFRVSLGQAAKGSKSASLLEVVTRGLPSVTTSGWNMQPLQASALSASPVSFRKMFNAEFISALISPCGLL